MHSELNPKHEQVLQNFGAFMGALDNTKFETFTPQRG